MRARLATLAITTCLLCAAPALAQDADSASGEDAPPPGADAYTQRIQAGIALITAGDTAGAQQAFRDAVGMDGNRPQAVYYLAVSNRLSGNLDDALEGFRRAVGNAAAEDLPRWQARALQGVAETLERMPGRLEEAYEAWQEYVRFSDGHQAMAFPQVGRARIQAYNVMHEQESAYVAVRERIAERERVNAQ